MTIYTKLFTPSRLKAIRVKYARLETVTVFITVVSVLIGGFNAISAIFDIHSISKQLEKLGDLYEPTKMVVIILASLGAGFIAKRTLVTDQKVSDAVLKMEIEQKEHDKQLEVSK